MFMNMSVFKCTYVNVDIICLQLIDQFMSVTVCFALTVALRRLKRKVWTHHAVRESRPEISFVKHITKTGEFDCKMLVPTNYISFGSACGSVQDHHKLLEILDAYCVGEHGLDVPTFPELVDEICCNGPIRRYLESTIERNVNSLFQNRKSKKTYQP